MDPARFLDALRIEGERLVGAAQIDLRAPVPGCPGWVAADVLGHLGRVYRSIHDIVVTRAQEPPSTPVPKPPAGDAVVDFFAEGHERLLHALAATPADVAVYTWSDDRTVGFYQRRMAHETGVHRVDVELAVGRPITPFDGDLAVDGIDELYGVVLPFGLARRNLALPAGSLHLHRTDGAGEWTIVAVDGTVSVSSTHSKATAAIRGPASDLFVHAWHRGRPATLEVLGDESVAAAWAALAP
jgi:uncharacterized protein (TIGR03083 family)